MSRFYTLTALVLATAVKVQWKNVQKMGRNNWNS